MSIALLERIRRGVIGEGEVLDGPQTPGVLVVRRELLGVRHGAGHLHHNFVVAVLNDLFGIQARGGCSCAGPYGHRLLGIDAWRSRALAEQARRGYLGVKPGWARVSFNYFISDAVCDYLVEAVDLVATHGHRLLGDYREEGPTGLLADLEALRWFPLPPGCLEHAPQPALAG